MNHIFLFLFFTIIIDLLKDDSRLFTLAFRYKSMYDLCKLVILTQRMKGKIQMITFLPELRCFLSFYVSLTESLFGKISTDRIPRFPE